MTQQPTSSAAEPSIREDMAQPWPFYVIVFLVLIGGYVTALTSNQSLWKPARLVLFTTLILLHGGLYWFALHVVRSRRWLAAYYVVQEALAFTIGLLTPGHWLVIALHFSLIGLIAGTLWPNLGASILATLLCLGLLALNITVSQGFREFVQFLPIAGLMALFVFIYTVLFVREVEAREQAQALLHELETVHRQLQEYAARIEELTISQERERMARELHDTLAQGLAGLILQLEAADSHLESGNPARAQAVVQQAMQRARATLHEARRAIQALRPAALERGNLIDALGREIDQFSANTGIRTTFDVADGPMDVSPEMAQDILRIVQESLSNVTRHADASHVLVQLAQSREGLQVVVQDDGVGFDPGEGLERPGCFGLAGMQERALRVGGALEVESARGRGTRVVLSVGEPSP
jgi:NarL family two-component system sensor histidine kinase YdfH